jgi:undecaprenyl-diphosphatase
MFAGVDLRGGGNGGGHAGGHAAADAHDAAPIREPVGTEREDAPPHPAVAGGRVWITGLLLLAATMVGIGLVVTELLDRSDLRQWDVDVARWFTDRRTSTWGDVTGFGSSLADTMTVVAIAAVIAGLLMLRRWWHDAIFIVSALVLEVSVFLITTALVDRPRPPVRQLDTVPPTASFPSGHTAAAIALYFGVAILVSEHVRNALVRGAAWLVAVLTAGSVGLSRMYRGMHFATDVLAGMLLGAACLVIATLTVRAVSRAVAARRSEHADSDMQGVMA